MLQSRAMNERTTTTSEVGENEIDVRCACYCYFMGIRCWNRHRCNIFLLHTRQCTQGLKLLLPPLLPLHFVLSCVNSFYIFILHFPTSVGSILSANREIEKLGKFFFNLFWYVLKKRICVWPQPGNEDTSISSRWQLDEMNGWQRLIY